MALEQIVNDQIKAAMLAKDAAKLRGLRAIKAAVIIAKTAEGAGGQLAEADETKLLQKLVKQRKDSLEIYRQQNRADLAQTEQEEIDVIEAFLPKQLSEEALKEALVKIIADTGAASPADMGKVMAAATKQLAGQADGKTISTIVKSLLAK
ncbi:GatB/YqeY domain-containing protein [Agriterribacter sp.]|uniref:GatB/YqeY domain-containing protein n=1 Tax=Agriterribacter sp. TaxID=2821509 RepID=UPI002BAC8F8C|nr:GatB/YqeY domain-containing protein [Agriterribacter sp.]HRP54492.1 GatB/YqeY domain-containing protein [Agriterribacter sp.]